MLKPINKSYREITGYSVSNASLLNLFNILKDENGKYLLNIFKTYDIDNTFKNNPAYYQYHDLVETDFWENLSYKYYNNKKLWWLFPLTNNIDNPFESIEYEETIKVLNNSLKSEIIKDIKRVGEG